MSSDGRTGRRGQTKKKTEYDGREAAPRVQAAHRRSCTGGKKVDRRTEVKPDRLVGCGFLYPSADPNTLK